MYFEVYALPSASVAATEVHTGNSTLPTRVLSDGNTLTDSSKKDVPTKCCVVSAVADGTIQCEKVGAAAARRGGSAVAPLDVNRCTGAEVVLEGFVIKQVLHFDASAGR